MDYKTYLKLKEEIRVVRASIREGKEKALKMWADILRETRKPMGKE